ARGLAEVERAPGHFRGRRLALAGIFAAGLGMFFQPLALLLAVQLVRDRVARPTDAANLEHIGEAAYQYHDRAGRLPPAASRAPNGRALLSWRVALLPHLGHGELYAKFHHDEPWDSPHNYAMVRRMPKVFAHPSDPGAAAKGLTYYRVLVGEGTLFNDRNGPRVTADFPNDTGMIMVIAAPRPMQCRKPNELRYMPQRRPP